MFYKIFNWINKDLKENLIIIIKVGTKDILV